MLVRAYAYFGFIVLTVGEVGVAVEGPVVGESIELAFQGGEGRRSCRIGSLLRRWVSRLRPRDLQRSSLTSLDVIRMLLYQALEINGSALNTSHPITVAQLREASSHDDWLLLLKRALLGLSGVYIIMDDDVMEYITRKAKKSSLETVRFMVSSHVFQTQQAKTDLGDEAVAAVRARRHMRHGNQAVTRREVRLSKGRHNC